MKRALIIDTETDGLDPTVNRALEVGCILYDLVAATPLVSFASLIEANANAAEHVNRIPPAALSKASSPQWVWKQVEDLMRDAQVILAHRAEFDRAFVPKQFADALPWVCTKSDMQWPKQTRPDPALVALALEHDLGVAYAHRALADCDLISRLLTRSTELGSNLVDMIRHGMRPKARFQALVSYDDREKAKTAGFQWDGATKTWWRTMAIDDVAALPFKTRRIEKEAA